MSKRTLVAYYSYSGNTKAVAEKIQKLTNSDLFEIEVKEAYPTGYNDVVKQAKLEKQNDVYPELKDNGNVENYDVIYLGTPVWWYTMATPVKTFLKENNFEGKVIIPFCTHGGGGASATYTDISKYAPNAKVLQGFTSYENSAKETEIQQWVENNRKDL